MNKNHVSANPHKHLKICCIVAEMLKSVYTFLFSFSLVLRLDNSEPLDFGQVAYYNRGLQGDDIQMSNIPGRYWQPCQTLLLTMLIDQTVDKVLLFVNRTILWWQLWAECTNGLMQMSFTVENLLVYFIQSVGFCGVLSSPHHSGSHHIGDSRWGKQSTRWWRSQRFPWKMMNYCRLFGCADRSEPEKQSHRLPIFYKSRRTMPNVIRGKEALVIDKGKPGATRQKSGHPDSFSSFLVT